MSAYQQFPYSKLSYSERLQLSEKLRRKPKRRRQHFDIAKQLQPLLHLHLFANRILVYAWLSIPVMWCLVCAKIIHDPGNTAWTRFLPWTSFMFVFGTLQFLGPLMCVVEGGVFIYKWVMRD